MRDVHSANKISPRQRAFLCPQFWLAGGPQAPEWGESPVRLPLRWRDHSSKIDRLRFRIISRRTFKQYNPSLLIESQGLTFEPPL